MGVEGWIVAKTTKSDAEPGEPVTAAQMGNGALPGGEVVGVDKIRDLLFGNQMQDYDRRFSKLEERFLQRFKDIEAETARNRSPASCARRRICAPMPTRRSSGRCASTIRRWRSGCARCRTS
jgi:hypothetical protein